MAKNRYVYTGPNSAVTLKVGDGAGGLKEQDVVLWHGKEVELPGDHEFTKTLEHQGLLRPISQAQVAQQSDDDQVASTSTKPNSAKQK